MKDIKTSCINWIKGIVVVILVVSSIFLCLRDFSVRSKNQAEQMVRDHLEDVGTQISSAFRVELENSLEEVRYVSSVLSGINHLTHDEMVYILQKMQDKCNFSKIRLTDSAGNIYTLSGEQINDGTNELVHNIRAGRSGITDQFQSLESGEEVFAVYAPVIKDNQISGGIVGIVVLEEMVDLVDSAGFQSRSYSYLIGSDGRMIMHTRQPDSLYDGRNFLDFLSEKSDEISIEPEEIRRNMKQGKEGFLNYRVGDQGRFAYYAPIHVNQWYSFTIVPTEVTNLYISRMDQIALHLTIKLAVLFAVLLVLVIVWMKRIQKLIIASKEETELMNKKFEQAMRHTSYILFEYYPDKNEFSFISSGTDGHHRFSRSKARISVDTFKQEFVDEQDTGRIQSLLNRINDGEYNATEDIQGNGVLGEDVWYRFSVTAIKNAKGKVVEAIGTMKDISEEVRARRRYAQEEQYRLVILSEALMVWSVDLVKQKLLTYTIKGEDYLSHSGQYNNKIIYTVCNEIHPEDCARILSFFKVNNMLAAYYSGRMELKELFRVRLEEHEEYRWITCVVNLLEEPVSSNPMAFAYAKDVDEELRREMELKYSSERDSLTGLYNRRNFELKVNQELTLNPDQSSALIMMDLDGFKDVNDRFGHKTGDEVLKEVGKILISIFRPEDMVARLGGDEFTVFIRSISDRAIVRARSVEVCKRINRMSVNGVIYQSLSVSIGIAYAPEHGAGFDTLYQNADTALYEAKRQGKNCAVIFTPEHSKERTLDL